MKEFFLKLKDFSPKLKVSEILLCLKPQNRLNKSLSSNLKKFTKLEVLYLNEMVFLEFHMEIRLKSVCNIEVSAITK